MNFENWSTQYSNQAQYLRGVVKSLKQKLKNTSPSESKMLGERIYILTSMYMECEKTADTLKNYYHGEKRA